MKLDCIMSPASFLSLGTGCCCYSKNPDENRILLTKCHYYYYHHKSAIRVLRVALLPATRPRWGWAWSAGSSVCQRWGREEGKQRETEVHRGPPLLPHPPHRHRLRRQSSQTPGSHPGRSRPGGACRSSPEWGSPAARGEKRHSQLWISLQKKRRKRFGDRERNESRQGRNMGEKLQLLRFHFTHNHCQIQICLIDEHGHRRSGGSVSLLFDCALKHQSTLLNRGFCCHLSPTNADDNGRGSVSSWLTVADTLFPRTYSADLKMPHIQLYLL